MFSEHATGWMLLHMLDLEMNGKTKTMTRAVRQYLILKNIIDLAASARVSASVRVRA